MMMIAMTMIVIMMMMMMMMMVIFRLAFVTSWTWRRRTGFSEKTLPKVVTDADNHTS